MDTVASGIADQQRLFELLTEVLKTYQDEKPDMPQPDVLCTLGNVAGFIIASAPEHMREQAIAHMATCVESSIPNFVEFLKQARLQQ